MIGVATRWREVRRLPPRTSLAVELIGATLWLVAVSGMGGQILTDPDAFGIAGIVGLLAGIGFIPVLIVLLARQPPDASELPEVEPVLWPDQGHRQVLLRLVGSTLALFAVGLILGPWLSIVFALTISMVWLTVRWRDRVRTSLLATGGGLAAALIVIQAMTEGLDGYMVGYLITVAPLFVGGALLLAHSGLTRSRIVDGEWWSAGRSFLVGAVLAVPAGLPIWLMSDPDPEDDAWVTDWWDPLAALIPAFAEEVWSRLVLTTLAYVALRPVCDARPSRAVWTAMLFAAMVHAQAHSPTPALLGPLLVTQTLNALAFGLPMALLFVKKDLEAAVGYHFGIDAIRHVGSLLTG